MKKINDNSRRKGKSAAVCNRGRIEMLADLWANVNSRVAPRPCTHSYSIDELLNMALYSLQSLSIEDLVDMKLISLRAVVLLDKNITASLKVAKELSRNRDKVA